MHIEISLFYFTISFKKAFSELKAAGEKNFLSHGEKLHMHKCFSHIGLYFKIGSVEKSLRPSLMFPCKTKLKSNKESTPTDSGNLSR